METVVCTQLFFRLPPCFSGGFLFDVSGAFTWSMAAAILTTCLGISSLADMKRELLVPACGPI
jgi:hypothetical protein